MTRQAAEISRNEGSDGAMKGAGNVTGKLRANISSSSDRYLSCWGLYCGVAYNLEDGTTTQVIYSEEDKRQL